LLAAGIEISTTFSVQEADTLHQLIMGQRGPEEGCYM
jgi:hypothetical protein